MAGPHFKTCFSDGVVARTNNTKIEWAKPLVNWIFFLLLFLALFIQERNSESLVVSSKVINNALMPLSTRFSYIFFLILFTSDGCVNRTQSTVISVMSPLVPLDLLSSCRVSQRIMFYFFFAFFWCSRKCSDRSLLYRL